MLRQLCADPGLPEKGALTQEQRKRAANSLSGPRHGSLHSPCPICAHMHIRYRDRIEWAIRGIWHQWSGPFRPVRVIGLDVLTVSLLSIEIILMCRYSCCTNPGAKSRVSRDINLCLYVDCRIALCFSLSMGPLLLLPSLQGVGAASYFQSDVSDHARILGLAPWHSGTQTLNGQVRVG